MAGEILIGTGGWSYFNVPTDDKLREYARAFDFVEVNSTFYSRIPIELCMSWRKRVPEKFIFTLRCHRDVTHTYLLNPVEPALEAFQYSLNIAHVLKAPIIILETPPSLALDYYKIVNFFGSVELNSIRVGLEIRGATDDGCFKAMQELGIIHVVDISREEPRYYDAQLAYSRLFGPGGHNIYQFDDRELMEINSKAENMPVKRIMLSFHGVKMYADGARLKVFRRTRKFPPITSKVGLDSLKEVLAEDNPKFPASRDAIIARYGWKLFDYSPTRRMRVSEALKHAPKRTYRDLDELIEALRETFDRLSET